MGLEDEVKKREKEQSVYEIYNQFSEKAKATSEKTLGFLTKYWEQIISLFLAFFMIGIQQFAEPTFDPLFFLRPDFWFEYIPYVMAIWIIIFSTITGNMKWLVEVDKTYIDTVNSIQKHVDEDKKTPYIYVGAKIEDKERKIKAWKKKISYKIDRLRIKSKIKSIGELAEFIETEQTLTKQKKLKLKFGMLLNQLEDDYVEKYYDTLKVRYDKVTETILVSGVTPTSNTSSESNFKEELGSVMFNEFGLGFIMTSLFSALILALDLMSKEATMATWVTFIFKLFMLYTYYFRATARSKPIFQKTRLKALQERDSMLEKIKRRIVKNENSVS